MHLDQTKDIDVWKRNKYGIINFTTGRSNKINKNGSNIKQWTQVRFNNIIVLGLEIRKIKAIVCIGYEVSKEGILQTTGKNISVRRLLESDEN